MTLGLSSVAILTYLHTRSMSEIQRIQLEPQMIVGVDHLMGHGIFHMTSVSELVGAQQNTKVRVKATALLCGAALNTHICLIQVMAQQVDVVAHESHYGRVLEQPFAILFCAGDVALFVDCVFDVEVGLSFLRRCASSQDVEESGPGVKVLVWCGRGRRLCRCRLR